jgi:hypothetical protein
MIAEVYPCGRAPNAFVLNSSRGEVVLKKGARLHLKLKSEPLINEPLW